MPVPETLHSLVMRAAARQEAYGRAPRPLQKGELEDFAESRHKALTLAEEILATYLRDLRGVRWQTRNSWNGGFLKAEHDDSLTVELQWCTAHRALRLAALKATPPELRWCRITSQVALLTAVDEWIARVIASQEAEEK